MKQRVDLIYQNEENSLAQMEVRRLCGRLWLLFIALKRIASRFLQYSYGVPGSN